MPGGIMMLRQEKYTKILVSEDDNDLRLMIMDLIKMNYPEGILVYEARDGIEAAWKINNDDIDILITDVIMPKKNGIDLVESILLKRERGPSYIFIMSGNVNHEMIKRLPPSKRVRYLVKPFRYDHLMNLLSETIMQLKKEDQKVYPT